VCHKEKSHGIFPSSSSSGTPSDATSDTPSQTVSDTPSNTKIVGKLVVVISMACVGQIDNMVFFHRHDLQLLSS
jgi:hypothetical protein